MTNSVTLNGTTYNDGTTPPNNMANGGHRDYLIPMLSDAVVDLAAKQAAAAASAASAASAAATAAFSLQYLFSTTTTDADPGAGYLRLDNATQNAATTIRADLVTSDASTVTDLLATFDDSSSTVTGQIYLVKESDSTKWLAFNVTALASPSGYKNITVACVASSSASPFVNGDAIVLKFSRTGDKGDTGTAGSSAQVISTRTSNTMLAAADQGKRIEITSGTFSQTFDACATLTSGWWVDIYNAGTGDITLDPNSTEQIDGLATFVMYPGECRRINVNAAATALESVVLSPFYRAITTTLNPFVIPPGYSRLGLDVIGGGGGGGSGRRGAAGTGRVGGSAGGAGARVRLDIVCPAAGTSVTATIGAAGVGGAAITADSTDGEYGVATGGTSSFGTYCVAYGGGRGTGGAQYTSAYHNGGSGGGSAGAGGYSNQNAAAGAAGGKPSQSGYYGIGSGSGVVDNIGSGGASGYNGTAGCSEWGGAAGGNSNNSTPGDGGSSIFGPTGGGGGGGLDAANNASNGGAGGLHGAYTPGGGAATSAVAGNPGTVSADGIGQGGGGGGSRASAGAAYAGGDGAAPGGGGGGGGASVNGQNSGKGGDGGRGEIRVWGIA